MIVVRYFFILLLVQSAAAQPPPDNSDIALANAIKTYHNSPGLQPALYNGLLYTGYHPSIRGFAFFGKDTWFKGSVLYDGVWYEDASLMYDIVADRLILRHMYGSVFYVFSGKVERFTLEDKSFVRLRGGQGQPPVDGFYQQLADGKANLVVRRIKTISEKIVDLTVERDFVESNKYYLQKDGEYVLISSFKSLLEILKDKKKPIKQYLKKNKIRYRRISPENAIVAAVRHYNELSR